MKSVDLKIKLLHLLLILSIFESKIFHALAEETPENPPAPETITGVLSSKNTLTNSTLSTTQENTFDQASFTEIISINSTIAEITTRPTTTFAHAQKPSTEFSSFNFTKNTLKSTTAISSIHEVSQNLTSTPQVISSHLSSSNTQKNSTKHLSQENSNSTSGLTPAPESTKPIYIHNKFQHSGKRRNKTKKAPCNTTRSKKKQKAPKTTPLPTSPKNKTTFKKISHTYTHYEWTGVRTDPTPREIDYRESNEFGEQSFKKFMIRTGFYVDKSLMIKEFLDDPHQVVLITRPRFWGKSLNLNMIRKFFEIEVDHQGEILPQEERTNRKIFCGGQISNGTAIKYFQPLKIADVPEAMTLQGNHPVIQLNYQFIRNGSYAEMEIGMKMQIIRSFKKHFYLENHFKSNPLELDHFRRTPFHRYCNGDLTVEDLKQSIRFMSELLYKYFNQTVFVLIDEYDAPLAEAFRRSSDDPKNLEKMLQFYRDFYKNAFEDNPYLAKGFITGKLRIENSNLFVNLTNIIEYTLLDHQFSQFYGFTVQEVDELLKDVKNETSREIKSFYGGFNYGGQYVFNPWSIKQCIENKYKLEIYWVSTGILYPANRKKYSLEAVQQDIKSLLGGDCVQIPVKNEVTFQGLENRTNFFNFILFTGYLSPSVKNSNGTYQLVKPNVEASRFYQILLGDWLEQHFRRFGRWGVTDFPDGQDYSDESSEPTYMSSLLMKYAIVPDIIPVAPRKLAQVFFSWGELESETSLHNNDTEVEPILEWDADDDSYYTIYLLTYNVRENTYVPEDSKMARYPYRPHYHNWIVINIPATNISMGQVLYSYVPPRNPISYLDMNYCTFLVYKQAAGMIELEADELDEPKWKSNSQYTPAVDFAANHSLGNPKFGNFFKMQFGSRISITNKKTELNESI